MESGDVLLGFELVPKQEYLLAHNAASILVLTMSRLLVVRSSWGNPVTTSQRILKPGIQRLGPGFCDHAHQGLLTYWRIRMKNSSWAVWGLDIL